MKFTKLLPFAWVSSMQQPSPNISQREQPEPVLFLVALQSATQALWSGEYSTVAAAVTALGSSTATASIFIYGGTWDEGQIYINYKGNLTFYGYTSE